MNILDLHEFEKENNIVDVVIGEVNGEKFSIKIKKYLSLSEFTTFLHDIQNAEFDDKNGKYEPEIAIVSFKLTFVKLFTDLVLPDDLGLAYQIINEFRIYEKICAVIDTNQQYFDIMEAMDRATNYKRNSTIGINKLYTAIADVINAVPWAELVGYAEEYMNPKNMTKLVDLLVENIDSDKLNSILKALG